jgi:hypothetical protein
MNPELQARLLELLYQALSEPFGIAIQTTNADKLRAALYKIKKDEPAFDCITLTLSPAAPATELWIRHGQVQREVSPEGNEIA